AVTAVVIAPWTYRNYRVTHGFEPLSMQDVAASGTFNDDAAHDPVYPWAWRRLPTRDLDLWCRGRFARFQCPRRYPGPLLSDWELRKQLLRRTRDYVSNHPSSLLKAFFWNGLSRFWDVRRPSRALNEVRFEGRSRLLTKTGL